VASPESAFPFFLTREPDALGQIADLLPPGVVLVTGGIRAADPSPNGRIEHAYNSTYVIDHDGSILGIYDKVHLVPFGEYLPFEGFFNRLGLTSLTKQRGGFLAGDRRRAMDVPRAPKMLPLICYEVVFPDETVPAAEREDSKLGWLLNLTNDAWFGISSGPYQHFHQARMQAVAQGLPLVRSANNGISAVIDPLGRVIGSLPLGAEGVLDAALPRAIAPPLFVRIADLPLVICLALSLVMVARRRFQS
jgi:apolipoprotein N-acyltransferase